jgi:hypothetical protein
MPPAVRPEKPYKPLPSRLPRARVGWHGKRRRFEREMNSFATPLNDLSFEERLHRVRALMHRAYEMGRKDQAELVRLRQLAATHRYLFAPKNRRAR